MKQRKSFAEEKSRTKTVEKINNDNKNNGLVLIKHKHFLLSALFYLFNTGNIFAPILFCCSFVRHNLYFSYFTRSSDVNHIARQTTIIDLVLYTDYCVLF